ncbi:MAG: hypothetical protein E6J73_14040 [Deltaproteobacteria bacterium]|nr:MAG: hypothetical protein E6J73_14040 [Deltaproteobacteria bacterium]
MRHRQPRVSLLAALIVARFLCLSSLAIGAETNQKTIQTVPGMPAVVDPKNLYSETRPENLIFRSHDGTTCCGLIPTLYLSTTFNVESRR